MWRQGVDVRVYDAGREDGSLKGFIQAAQPKPKRGKAC